MQSQFFRACGLIVLIQLFMGFPAWAGWEFGGEASTFYTDDVSIFSSSQRLSLQEDPTQPVIDVTGQGKDVVFEPVAFVRRSFQPSWGNMEVTARAQGFVFTEHSEFSHATYGVQVTQALPAESLLRLRYHYGPNMLLGNHRENRLRESRIGAERVTTHFGTIELERKFLENVTVRVLTRYGARLYNEAFSQRNTNFWTIGTHAEWEVRPGIEFMIGYHYERGLAAGRKQPEFGEDLSFFTHYVEADVRVRVTERASIRLGFDFERNTFTSGLPEDDFRGATEHIYQGEAEARYELSKAIDLTLGYLRGQRKFSFEENSVTVNTVWLGSAIRF